MTGTITIQNHSQQHAEIDIEGVIGIPEEWQFDNAEERTATYEKFRSQVNRLREVAAPQLVVNIRSTGGNVNDALLILDTLNALKSEITTRCYGYVASAATLIAQAASPGKREMSANGLYLIHKSACSSEGNSNDLAQTAQMLHKTDERIAAIYAGRSGLPAKSFIELMECNNGNGKWLSPEEAQAAALIDVILPAGVATQPVRPELPLANLTDQPLNLNQNTPPMTIKQHWNAIVDLLGLAPAAATQLQDNSTLTEQQPGTEPEQPSALSCNQQPHTGNPPAPSETSSVQAYLSEIAALKQQVTSLESLNVRLQALPTRTKPKEDPSPTESKLSGNALSYNEDIRNFK